MTRPPVVRLDAVSKRLGPVQALAEFDLTVPEGEFVALLGPNGAGKTTAHSIAVGLRRPDSGIASLLGADPRSPASRRSIGVAPQVIGMPAQLKVRELLDLVRTHFRRPYPAGTLLEQFDLGHLADRQAGGLSPGETRRLTIALAFAGRPRALFLDEPTNGLDSRTRRMVWSILADFVTSGGTILMSTHYIEEAEALATRVAIVDRGRLLAEGSVSGITALIQTKRVSFVAPNPPRLPTGAKLTREGERYVVRTTEADSVVRAIAASCDFRDLQILRASLEEAITWLIQGRC